MEFKYFGRKGNSICTQFAIDYLLSKKPGQWAENHLNKLKRENTLKYDHTSRTIYEHYHPNTIEKLKHFGGFGREYISVMAKRMAGTDIRPSKDMLKGFIPFVTECTTDTRSLKSRTNMKDMDRVEQNANIFFLNICGEVYRILDLLKDGSIQFNAIYDIIIEHDEILKKAQDIWDENNSSNWFRIFNSPKKRRLNH